jgi:hypothetical protein
LASLRRVFAGEVEMKKIDVADKAQIKQLLYADCVLGIKDDRYNSFGGFQLWWYDKHLDVCNCCDSSWSDPRKKIRHRSLDEAANVLWRKRKSLFLRTKHMSEDSRLKIMDLLAKS